MVPRSNPVFHVSQLKRGTPRKDQLYPAEPFVDKEGKVLAEPEQVLERRMVKKGNRAVTQVLIKWSNLGPEDATWEDYWAIKA